MIFNIKISAIVVLVLFCLVGAKMHIKQEYKKMDAKIQERDFLLEEVRILEAEYAYLNSMDRIDKLSSQYLSLNTVANKVIVLDKKPVTKNSSIAEVKQRPNWRYKNRNYIMNIKHDVR